MIRTEPYQVFAIKICNDPRDCVHAPLLVLFITPNRGLILTENGKLEPICRAQVNPF